jgi:hypothetical protein
MLRGQESLRCAFLAIGGVLAAVSKQKRQDIPQGEQVAFDMPRIDRTFSFLSFNKGNCY